MKEPIRQDREWEGGMAGETPPGQAGMLESVKSGLRGHAEDCGALVPEWVHWEGEGCTGHMVPLLFSGLRAAPGRPDSHGVVVAKLEN